MTISAPRGTASAQASANIAFIKYWGIVTKKSPWDVLFSSQPEINCMTSTAGQALQLALFFT
jgi:hypothetical protein